jgi:hypothetical protein
MQLTQADQDKVKKWLEQKASSGLRCFVCGNQRWGIGEFAAMTVGIDTHTSRIHYMQGYPLVALICEYCAHTVWFNANVIGLRPE